MKLSDFKGLFKTSIGSIESIENPYEDYYTIKINVSHNTRWEAGEHAIFSLPNADFKDKKWRAFSVASTFEEGYILIGTRTGQNISPYKKFLINMKKGDEISIRGPFGWFKLVNNNSPLVFIAGGVGITPIRALLQNLQTTNRDVEIVYSSNKFYLFNDDIEKIVFTNSSINLSKTVNKSDTIEKITTISSKLNNNAYYYISGSPGFIKEIKNYLKSNRIKAKNIINDPFTGY